MEIVFAFVQLNVVLLIVSLPIQQHVTVYIMGPLSCQPQWLGLFVTGRGLYKQRTFAFVILVIDIIVIISM